eukprot:scaffold88540_cov61-Phaeocystis_antarctica.AAC.4
MTAWLRCSRGASRRSAEHEGGGRVIRPGTNRPCTEMWRLLGYSTLAGVNEIGRDNSTCNCNDHDEAAFSAAAAFFVRKRAKMLSILCCTCFDRCLCFWVSCPHYPSYHEHALRHASLTRLTHTTLGTRTLCVPLGTCTRSTRPPRHDCRH